MFTGSHWPFDFFSNSQRKDNLRLCVFQNDLRSMRCWDAIMLTSYRYHGLYHHSTDQMLEQSSVIENYSWQCNDMSYSNEKSHFSETYNKHVQLVLMCTFHIMCVARDLSWFWYAVQHSNVQQLQPLYDWNQKKCMLNSVHSRVLIDLVCIICVSLWYVIQFWLQHAYFALVQRLSAHMALQTINTISEIWSYPHKIKNL